MITKERSHSLMLSDGQVFDSMPLLEELLSEKFGGILEAVAATTVFPPQSIVKALEAKAVCNAIRIATGDDREDMLNIVSVRKQYHGKEINVILDENLVPNKVFLFCFNSTKKGTRSVYRSSHTQLNHIYTCAGKSPDYFANLANLCISPSFMAKLTDLSGDKGVGSEVVELLKFRSFQLYGFNPERKDFSDSHEKFGDWEEQGKWLKIPEENIATFEQFSKRVNTCRDRYFLAACKCGKNQNL